MNKINKHLLALIFIINLGVVLYFWVVGSLMFFILDLSSILYALGKLTGLLAAYFVLLQFLLMGRAVWLEKTFGFDKLAIIHRLNGYVSFVFIILHPVCLTLSYAMDAKVGFVEQFMDFFYNYKDVNTAVLATFLFILIVFLSIYIVKKKIKYETWYALHFLTYLAVLLAFGHQLKLGGDFAINPLFVYYWYFLYFFVFGNVVLFRFFKPIYNFYRSRFVVNKIAAETDTTHSIYIKGKNIKDLNVKPGQFFILRFLAKKFWLQAHPFSLSSVPNNDYLRFTIKASGDFTAAVPSIKPGTHVLLEGPYGVFTPQFQLDTKYLFIAGGVGITPIRSLIEKLAPSHNIILLYNCRDLKDVIFKKELEELAQQHGFSIYYVMSHQQDYSGEKGRIDAEKLQKFVPDILDREIYICGPPPMIKSVKNILFEDFNVKPSKIHYELFSL